VTSLHCPRCGSRDVVPILYGYPPDEWFEAAERGELIIGGCEIEPETKHCASCGNKWNSDLSPEEWLRLPIAAKRRLRGER
jgi:hypothetical protein